MAFTIAVSDDEEHLVGASKSGDAALLFNVDDGDPVFFRQVAVTQPDDVIIVSSAGALLVNAFESGDAAAWLVSNP